MQRAEAKHTTKRTLAAPPATGSNGDRPRDVVLVVVHDQAQRAVQKVFNKLSEPRVAADKAFRAADDVVAIWQEASYIGGRVGDYVEDVPDIFSEGERRPLE
jgi:hypothetical protein